MSELDAKVLTRGRRRRWTAALALCLVLCGGSLAVPAAHAVVPAVDPGGFVGLAPTRLLDTRTDRGRLSPGETRPLLVTDVGGVPSSGVAAVVLNVTVTETTSIGYLTVSPTGTPRPVVSNLNWTTGVTIPNAVTVKVGTGGSIDLFQSGPGTAQVVVDVSGYYVDGAISDAGAFTAVTPARVLDTRSDGGTLRAGETRDRLILDGHGVPANNVSAVVLNVTVTETTAGGYLTVFPTGTTPRPTASNLNWAPGQTIPNLVVVKVGIGGKVSFFQSGVGTAQVVVDIAGYFRDGTVTQVGMYVPVSPSRVLDTRNNANPLRPMEDRSIVVAGPDPVPAVGVGAVVLNTTVTQTGSVGFLTVHPGFSQAPLASNLNWSGAGVTIANLVTVQLGSSGSVGFRNGAGTSTHVIADVAGYYRGVTPAALTVTAVATGGYHTCAVSTGEVRCWGLNNYGQLGNGTTPYSATPIRVPGLSGVTAVVAGEAHTCALSGGYVWCWGLNGDGQLGDTTGIDRSQPVLVPNLTGVTAIAAGKQHTCAVAAAGTVWCWGWNSSGQLGDGSTTQRLGPVQVVGLSGAVAVTAGYQHTCAVTGGGMARCWGYNLYGQLGDGTVSDRLSPVPVSGLSGASAVTAGRLHTCAIASGAVKCWGYNGDGQLGDGTNTDKSTPVTVPGLTGVPSLAAGDGHSCAVTGGQAWCWGENSYGQLGDGDTANVSSPASVFGLSSVSSVVAGRTTSCALTTTGALRCWGQNNYGQLGDGTYTDSPIPVAVTGMS